MLPITGPLAEIGAVAKTVIAGYFDDINDAGGIYNRRLELHVIDAPDASSIGAKAKRLIEEEQVFCLAGAFTAGADDGAFALMKSAETPLIGPFTLFPQVGLPPNRQVFYLFSGLKERLFPQLNREHQILYLFESVLSFHWSEIKYRAGQ